MTDKTIIRIGQGIVAVIVILGCIATGRAASVTVAWDYPYTNHSAVGFYVYYGQASRTYPNKQDAQGPDTRTISVDDLDPSKTYYFTLTAYNSHTNESDYCAELVWDNVPPTVTAPDKIVVDLQAGQVAVLPDYTSLITATDDFPPQGKLAVTQTPAAGSPLTAGMTLAFSATDEAGNTARIDRMIDVTIELTKPVRNASGVASDGKRLQVNKGAK